MVRACGIYIIRNVASRNERDCYIGQAIYVARRLAIHKLAILRGNHANERIRKAAQKYGPLSFSYDLLEACDSQQLYIREAHWVRVLKPKYNQAKIPSGLRFESRRVTAYLYDAKWWEGQLATPIEDDEADRPAGLLWDAIQPVPPASYSRVEEIFSILTPQQSAIASLLRGGNRLRDIAEILGISRKDLRRTAQTAAKAVEKYFRNYGN